MSYIGLDIGGTNIRYAFIEGIGLKALKYQKTPFFKTGNPCTEVEENICSRGPRSREKTDETLTNRNKCGKT